MFKKLREKKGMTLIEMMAVIAIIAVLVAVVVPIVSNGAQKSRAAANAANLRSVEAQFASILVTDPDAFSDKADRQAVVDFAQGWVDATASTLQQAQDNLKVAQDAVNNFDVEEMERLGEKVGDAKNDLLEATAKVKELEQQYEDAEWWEKPGIWILVEAAQLAERGAQAVLTPLEERLKDAENTKKQLDAALVDAQKQVAQYQDEVGEAQGNLAEAEYMLYAYPAENGIITLDNGMTVAAPVSKAVDIDNVSCEEGTQMIVYINPELAKIEATYGKVTKYDFAAVAGDKMQ